MLTPYGFLIAFDLGFLYLYCRFYCRQYLVCCSSIEKILSWAAIFALIGARFYHILSYLHYYLSHPIKIFYVWEGGLGIFGAIIGGLIGLIIYSHLYKENLNYLLNLITPPLLLAQAIGRLGNFFNHEGFGPPTNLAWKIFIPPQYRPFQYLENPFFHPTFFYESILCFLAFLFFVFLPKKIKISYGFSYYLISYGLIRFITEFWRIDTWKISQIQVAKILALSLIASGVIVLSKRYKKIKK